MVGYSGRIQPAEGVHSPPFARASVCKAGDCSVALVVLDVIGIGRDNTNAIREHVERATGIPPSHVLIATTHSHSGPVTTYFRDALPAPKYMVALRKGIVRYEC